MSPALASIAAEVARAYEEGIVEAGKQPELFALLAFLITFAAVRTVTHMIKRGAHGVGNLEVGGLHIHHLVWGILLLLVVGYLGIALEPVSPWRELLAVLFGIGAALTLDEFALWLNLRDVYWSHEGRRSIDAVVVAAALGALAVLGFGVWVDLAVEVETLGRVIAASAGFVGIALALACALKGKLFTAAAALFVPLVGLVGAIRLAHPSSPWARLYSPQRLARAEERHGSRAGAGGAR